jgi:hypothetical protein
MIGAICFDRSKLCRNYWKDSMGSYFFHEQHIALCRNLTFWHEERNRGYCGEGFSPCTGNFPGFCKPDNEARLLLFCK